MGAGAVQRDAENFGGYHMKAGVDNWIDWFLGGLGKWMQLGNHCLQQAGVLGWGCFLGGPGKRLQLRKHLLQ